MKLLYNLLSVVVSIQLPALCLGGGNLVSEIEDRTIDKEDPDGLAVFHYALQTTGLLNEILGNETTSYTVFAPANSAFKSSELFSMYLEGLDEKPLPRWNHHLRASLRQHIVPNHALNHSQIFDSQKTELESLYGPIVVAQFEQYVQGASIIEQDIQATNGVLHVVNKVVDAKFYNEPFAELTLQSEYGPDHLGRVSMLDVVNVNNATDELKVNRPTGTTFIGCRIRAFNRLEEYLPQTISNETDYNMTNVKYGELMNPKMRAENIHNFIQYSQIPKNYYMEDLGMNFMELTVPIPNCGHMFVTKNKGQLCFNNGCVVQTPDPRQFLASNGIGYVIDKCQVCPGVAMLVGFAADYTVYNLEDTADFFRASEWNLRDLRLSVGDRVNKVTLFAAISTGWSFFNLEDATRLASDKWKRHQWDLLAHMMVQGEYTYQNLLDRYTAEGAFEMTSLIGEPIKFDFDTVKNRVTVAEGDIFFPDIQGVDGLVHFVNEVPLPKSMTHTVYDFAKEDYRFATMVTYMDSVYLSADVKRLLPLTTLWAPNEVFENVVTKMEDISAKVLKSHIFEDLLWCDELIEHAGNGTRVSLNEREWIVSVNEAGFPCFETAEEVEVSLGKACITKCDIMARNGIVHELDNMMLFETPETRPPSAFGSNSEDRGGTGGGDPTPTFQRPVQKINDDSNNGGNNGGSSSETDGEIAAGEGEQSGAYTMSIGIFTFTLSIVLNILFV